MIKKLKKIHQYPILYFFVLGSFIGLLTFVGIYGWRILDVTYDAWLLEDSSDLTQHYLGWKYFRNSEWSFPIGLIEGLMPQKVSVIYTDSIPIAAVIFKVFSGWLPAVFQYFGIWGLLCFMLQGGITALITKKYIKSSIVILGSSLLLCLSPILIQRMFIHTALASQWIILGAVFLCVYNESFKTYRKKVLAWCILTAMSVMIHMYYLPFVIGIMFFNSLYQFLLKRNFKQEILLFIFSIVTALITMLSFGAFYGNVKVYEGGFGYYSANLNALVNSQGTSNILKAFGVFEGQSEGYAYLGFGVIVLLILGIVGFLNRSDKKELIKSKKEAFVVFILFLLTFLIYAISNNVTLGNHVILNIQLPKIILGLFSIFRVSGRFMWPIAYATVFLAIFLIVFSYKKKVGIFIILFCSALQVFDISSFIQSKQNKFKEAINNSTQLESEVWSYIAKGKNKLEYITFESEELSKQVGILWSEFSMADIFRLANYANENNLVCNDFYLGRRNENTLVEEKLESLKLIKNYEGREDTIYVFSKIPYSIINNSNLLIYEIENILVGLANELPSLYFNESVKPILIENMDKYSVLPKDNNYINLGVDNEEGRIIYKNGTSYGPYMTLNPNKYLIEISGENLENVYYTTTYNLGDDLLNVEEVIHNDNTINYIIDTQEKIHNVEFIIQNISNENIVIHDMNITTLYQKN